MTIAYAREINAGTLSLVPTPGAVGEAHTLHCLYEIVNITTIAVDNDTADVGYLPKGARPVWGYFGSADLDTGTESLDMDLGITANGVDSADADFFMNGGVFTGDAITDLPLTNAANIRFFTGPFPVTTLGARTLVQMKTIAAANATGTGKFVVCINYLLPGSATS
jgi:hypothetical protein